MIKQGLASAALQTLSAVFSILLITALSRLLPVSALGIYLMLHGAVFVVAWVVNLGAGTLLMRDVAALVGTGHLQNIAPYLTAFLRRLLPISILLAILFGFGISLVLTWLFPDSMPATLATGAFYSLWLLGFAWRDIFSRLLRAVGEYAGGNLFAGTFGNISLFFIFSLLYLFAWPLDLRGAIILTSVINIIAPLLATLLLLRRLRGLRLAEAPHGETQPHSSATMRAALPFLVISMASFAMIHAPVWLAGLLADETAAATFGTLGRMVELVGFPAMLVLALTAPLLSRYWAGGKKADFVLVVRGGGLLILLATLPLSVFFMLAPEWSATVLYGSQFGRADIVVLLATAKFLWVLGATAEFILMMTGRERTFVYILLSSLAALMLLAWPASSVFGVAGLAGLTALAMLLRAALALTIARRHVGFSALPDFSVTTVRELKRRLLRR